MSETYEELVEQAREHIRVNYKFKTVAPKPHDIPMELRVKIENASIQKFHSDTLQNQEDALKLMKKTDEEIRDVEKQIDELLAKKKALLKQNSEASRLLSKHSDSLYLIRDRVFVHMFDDIMKQRKKQKV